MFHTLFLRQSQGRASSFVADMRFYFPEDKLLDLNGSFTIQLPCPVCPKCKGWLQDLLVALQRVLTFPGMLLHTRGLLMLFIPTLDGIPYIPFAIIAGYLSTFSAVLHFTNATAEWKPLQLHPSDVEGRLRSSIYKQLRKALQDLSQRQVIFVKQRCGIFLQRRLAGDARHLLTLLRSVEDRSPSRIPADANHAHRSLDVEAAPVALAQTSRRGVPRRQSNSTWVNDRARPSQRSSHSSAHFASRGRSRRGSSAVTTPHSEQTITGVVTFDPCCSYRRSRTPSPCDAVGTNDVVTRPNSPDALSELEWW